MKPAWTIFAVLLSAPAAPHALCQTAIERVDPPSWWTGHSLNTVRLMFTGQNLTSGKLATGSPDLQAGPVTVAENGGYAFADLHIALGAKHRTYKLTLNGATVTFDVLPPLARSGRFRGFDENDVIYLIMIDRFANGDMSNDYQVDRSNPRAYHGGDFEGIRQRLPYLKDLGVTALWLTPVYDNPEASYHGYHAIDFYAVDEHFGNARNLRDLVDAAHRAGIKVIQDQVVNHVAAGHPWVTRPPGAAWFNGTPDKHLRPPDELRMDASPAVRRATTEGWFAGVLPDLNQRNREVSRYLIQNALWWIGTTGIDGIRQDTVPYVEPSFWRDWNAAIRREYPTLDVVGEVFSRDARLLTTFDRAGFASLFDFPLYFAARNVFARRTPRYADLPAALALGPANTRVTFLGNHDVRRLRTELPDIQAVKDAFTFQLTTRGIPMIYSGDEIGMEGGEDPDNRRDFPSESGPAGSDVLNHVRALLQLRARTPALRSGTLQNLAAGAGHYVFARSDRGAVVVVALGKLPVADVRAPGMSSGTASDSLGSGSTASARGGVLRITGPGVFVLEGKRSEVARAAARQ
jgi:neopullulanase